MGREGLGGEAGGQSQRTGCRVEPSRLALPGRIVEAQACPTREAGGPHGADWPAF